MALSRSASSCKPEVLVAPDRLVAGVADEEEQPPDVELRRDPELDVGDLATPTLPAGPMVHHPGGEWG